MSDDVNPDVKPDESDKERGVEVEDSKPLHVTPAVVDPNPDTSEAHQAAQDERAAAVDEHNRSHGEYLTERDKDVVVKREIELPADPESEDDEEAPESKGF